MVFIVKQDLDKKHFLKNILWEKNIFDLLHDISDGAELQWHGNKIYVRDHFSYYITQFEFVICSGEKGTTVFLVVELWIASITHQPWELKMSCGLHLLLSYNRGMWQAEVVYEDENRIPRSELGCFRFL